MYDLTFDPEKYEIQTLEEEGRRVTFRAFRDLVYVKNPVLPEQQKMNLFVPEAYYHGEEIRGFSAETAPIFFPNLIGAYMSGRADQPGKSIRTYDLGKPNASFKALERGFVVAAPATRGRDSRTEDGFVGTAPAHVVDLKAAVRYLRHNRGRIVGDTERIISDGTSAGGAMSALLGASGNAAEYEPYLAALGAADERDDIFGAVCFCPIMNLEHADAAYEWQYGGMTHFSSARFVRGEDGIVKMVPWEGELDAEQQAATGELREEFVRYVNALGLPDGRGGTLALAPDGTGSFRDRLVYYLKESAKRAMPSGIQSAAVTVRDGQVTDLDLDAYVRELGRMKPCPAFDEWEGTAPENEEFGVGTDRVRHFSAGGMKHDRGRAAMAEESAIRLLNPMTWLKEGAKADAAKHFYVRHGAADRHTSFAIPMIFAESLAAAGIDVDFALAWGRDHSGDYEAEEMFGWMERIARER